MQYFAVCTISQCAVMHHISLRLVRCRPGPAAAIILQATRPTAAKRQGRKDVTTLVRSIAAIERNLVKHGLAARCGRVDGADVPVLALEEPGSSATAWSKRKIATTPEFGGNYDKARKF